MNKILLLEDDVKLAGEVRLYLTRHGYEVDVIYDGLQFINNPFLKEYDLFILDINVPTVNGIEVCNKIREKNNRSPILMLTAYSDIEQKVKAFKSGADDYLVKPFHFEELDARLQALLRRHDANQKEDDIITVGDLIINRSERTASRQGQTLTLTPKEYKLVELLAMAKGRTISKQTIAEEVWDLNFETGTNTIEVYINFLRNKVDKPFATKLIHTRPGFGYYLKAED